MALSGIVSSFWSYLGPLGQSGNLTIWKSGSLVRGRVWHHGASVSVSDSG